MARCSASMPQPGTSSMNTLKAGSSNWMTSTPSASQRARFLVEQAGEGHRHLHLVAVVRVGDGVGDRHRPGQRDLQFALGMGAGMARLRLVHAALELQFAAHHRHHGFVAVGADAHLDLVREVDAVDEFEKAVHEMLARHFAVADDVDAGVFLQFDRQQRGVELACASSSPCSRHCGHSLFGSASQDGFGRLPATVDGNIIVGSLVETFGRPPTIEPVVAASSFSPPIARIARLRTQRLRAAQPIDAALPARGLLGARGAVPARAFVAAQRVGRIVAIFAQHIGEHRGILDRHAGALREERQHRVGGVPDQRHRARAAAERRRCGRRAPTSASARASRSARARCRPRTSARSGAGFRRGRRRPTSRSRSIRRARCRRC